MNPLHAHFAVDDLAAGVRFYSTMFASAPTLLTPDYAKWMRADPRMNFAISRRGAVPCVTADGGRPLLADGCARRAGA